MSKGNATNFQLSADAEEYVPSSRRFPETSTLKYSYADVFDQQHHWTSYQPGHPVYFNEFDPVYPVYNYHAPVFGALNSSNTRRQRACRSLLSTAPENLKTQPLPEPDDKTSTAAASSPRSRRTLPEGTSGISGDGSKGDELKKTKKKRRKRKKQPVEPSTQTSGSGDTGTSAVLPVAAPSPVAPESGLDRLASNTVSGQVTAREKPNNVNKTTSGRAPPSSTADHLRSQAKNTTTPPSAVGPSKVFHPVLTHKLSYAEMARRKTVQQHDNPEPAPPRSVPADVQQPRQSRNVPLPCVLGNKRPSQQTQPVRTDRGNKLRLPLSVFLSGVLDKAKSTTSAHPTVPHSTGNSQPRRKIAHHSLISSMTTPKRKKIKDKKAKKLSKLRKILLAEKAARDQQRRADLGSTTIQLLASPRDNPDAAAAAGPSPSITAPLSGVILNLQPPEVIRKIHTRKFREYCDHFSSTEIRQLTRKVLSTLRRFQVRAWLENPIKAKTKQRLVMGIRETRRYLIVHRVICLFIATDLDRSQFEGGLNDQLADVLQLCRTDGVPVVFGATKFCLGRVMGRRTMMSLVAVLRNDGVLEPFQQLLSLVEEQRKLYQQHVIRIRLELGLETPVEATDKEGAAAAAAGDDRFYTASPVGAPLPTLGVTTAVDCLIDRIREMASVSNSKSAER